MADLAIKPLTPARPKKGEQTRERILEIAEARILRYGFAGVSIDDIIAEAGLTRSGFVYHFPDKHHLAKALIERYLAFDEALFEQLFERADALVEDPLHALLAFLRLFSEVMADLPSRHPGCLVASYCYQEQMFSQEIRELSATSLIAWRRRFRARLDLIALRYPKRLDIDLDALANLILTLVEGGIILDKARMDTGALPRQILLARSFVRMAFEP